MTDRLNITDVYLLARAVHRNRNSQHAVPLEDGEQAAASRLVRRGLLFRTEGGNRAKGAPVCPTNAGGRLVAEWLAGAEVEDIERALADG